MVTSFCLMYPQKQEAAFRETEVSGSRRPFITLKSSYDLKPNEFTAFVENFLTKWRFHAYSTLVSQQPIDVEAINKTIEMDFLEL